MRREADVRESRPRRVEGRGWSGGEDAAADAPADGRWGVMLKSVRPVFVFSASFRLRPAALRAGPLGRRRLQPAMVLPPKEEGRRCSRMGSRRAAQKATAAIEAGRRKMPDRW